MRWALLIENCVNLDKTQKSRACFKRVRTWRLAESLMNVFFYFVSQKKEEI